jgi:hypothetical protein
MSEPGPTFRAWLEGQTERVDGIGGMAREVVSDTCWPAGPMSVGSLNQRTIEPLVLHLEKHPGPPERVVALVEALIEWACE